MEFDVAILYQGLVVAIILFALYIFGLGILTFGRQINDNLWTESRRFKTKRIKRESEKETNNTDHYENTIKNKPTSDENLIRNAKRMLDSYKHQKIALAVIGRSNMGKSSFINLIRDVDDKSDDYAQTGFGDTTMEVTEYKHPQTENISLWDLPGLGTSVMTKQRFMKEVKLDMFDFFFIFLDSVLMEDDIWLVEKLKERYIPYCFVRSKVDIDISNGKYRGMDQTDVINAIKEKISKSISSNDKVKGSKFFLISNVKEHFHVGELTSLFKYLVDKINVCKIETLLFFLPLLNPDIIEMKYESMKRRINFVATLAATVSAIPIPLVDIPANAQLIKREVSIYISVFGLDKDYVRKVPNLKHGSNLNADFGTVLKSYIHKYLSMGIIAATSQADVFIPVVGSAIAATTSYAFVQRYLENTLNEVRTDALSVYRYYKKAETKL